MKKAGSPVALKLSDIEKLMSGHGQMQPSQLEEDEVVCWRAHILRLKQEAEAERRC
jgi:hypothetical protein